MQENKYYYPIPVYVDSDGSECSEAILSYSPSTDETRFYRMRARQYDCNDEYLAGPKGCLQYLTNYTFGRLSEEGLEGSQEIFSFNGPWFDPATRHLANQGLNFFAFLFLCLMQHPQVSLKRFWKFAIFISRKWSLLLAHCVKYLCT